MENLFITIENSLKKKIKLVIARIIWRDGSTPREIGTTCLIFEDGSIMGSVGGGILEHQVIEASKAIINHGKSSIFRFELSGKETADTNMICGGRLEVYLEPVIPDNASYSFFKEIKSMVDNHGKGRLLTLVKDGIPANETCRMLLKENGSTAGSFGQLSDMVESEKDTFLKIDKPTLVKPDCKGAFIFVEPVFPEDHLVIFGGGHISTFVAQMAKIVGFRVVVIDDREKFANQERFPTADQVIASPFSEAFEHVRITSSSYIVIVTRGHLHDRNVLLMALKTTPFYIGMIGSKRKRKLIYESLLKEGIQQKQLEEVRSPIGLDILAQTPEEIAISIVAQLIKERALKKHKEDH